MLMEYFQEILRNCGAYESQIFSFKFTGIIFKGFDKGGYHKICEQCFRLSKTKISHIVHDYI